jgi:hypothetical protein
MPEPTDFQKREFFDKNKDKPNDPSAEDYGLETPAKAKIEFLYADLKSPAYLELAKTLAVLKRVSPAGLCLMQTPLANAVRYVALAEQDFKIDLQRQYDSMTRNPVNRDRYHRAAYFSERDFATPVVEFYARKAGAESVASFLGAAMASSISPLEAVNAAAGHLAWGAMGRPASDPKIRDEEREKHEAGVMDALKSEARRRARVYADVASFFPLHQSPFDVMGPFMALDNDHIAFKVLGPGFRIMDHFPPRFTIETVESEIRGILAERVAEGWAQTNMEIVREKLSKATDAEQFKRELKVLIPKYKLTLGPTGDAKNTYYSRFTVGDAKELEVLKNAFETYVDMIIMFEGRDMTPEKMLKSADFWKMFFGSEPTFTATGVYRAMAWPPEVEPNTARLWTKTNQRLINEKNVNAEEGERFLQHLRDTSPEKKPTNLDLFKTAGQPILFWRSSDISSKRQADYDGIAKELVRLKGDVAKLEEQFKKKADNQTNEELRKKQAEVKDVEDLQTRIVEGWKFDQARSTKAIPEAKELALSKLGKTNNFDDLSALANKMNLKVTRVRELSPMQPANNPGGRDYYEPSLPKDAIDFPRDDTVKNLLGLYNMQAPITIGYKELDDINRELFDKAKALNLPDGFAQILTNKPRSRFYVAFVTNTPKAERDDFQFAMKHAVAGPRDFFADRAQESDAQVYRQNFVAALKQRYNYSCDDETKARQEFDDIRRAPGE